MTNANAKPTAVLLCYSSAYRILAQRIAADLGKANVRVNHDPWRGGGGLPAFQSLPNKVDEVQAVVVLLTPSESARTWLNDDWVRNVYDPACASGITVLPARGEWCDIPDFLKHLSFADFCNRGYDSELRRLLQASPITLTIAALTYQMKNFSQRFLSTSRRPRPLLCCCKWAAR